MNLLELSQPFLGRGRRYVEGDPRHLLMYVFGRFHAIRCVLVWIYSLRQAKPLPADAPTLVEKVDIDGAVRTLHQDGLFAGLQLRKELMQQLLNVSSIATCYGDGKANYPVHYSDDAETERSYGCERRAILCGPAGFGFAEDRFGFHKGASPENGDRLLIQLRYGLRDYGANAAGRFRKKVCDDSYSR
jgi:hypothetical protein